MFMVYSLICEELIETEWHPKNYLNGSQNEPNYLWISTRFLRSDRFPSSIIKIIPTQYHSGCTIKYWKCTLRSTENKIPVIASELFISRCRQIHADKFELESDG